MKNAFILFFYFYIIALFLVSCNTSTNNQDNNSADSLKTQQDTVIMPPPADTLPRISPSGKVGVEKVDVLQVGEGVVHVLAAGNHPNGCTHFGEIIQNRKGNHFTVEMKTFSPPGAQCPQGLMPFAHTVALETKGLPKGDYTVEVNGIHGSFSIK